MPFRQHARDVPELKNHLKRRFGSAGLVFDAATSQVDVLTGDGSTRGADGAFQRRGTISLGAKTPVSCRRSELKPLDPFQLGLLLPLSPFTDACSESETGNEQDARPSPCSVADDASSKSGVCNQGDDLLSVCSLQAVETALQRAQPSAVSAEQMDLLRRLIKQAEGLLQAVPEHVVQGTLEQCVDGSESPSSQAAALESKPFQRRAGGRGAGLPAPDPSLASSPSTSPISDPCATTMEFQLSCKSQEEESCQPAPAEKCDVPEKCVEQETCQPVRAVKFDVPYKCEEEQECQPVPEVKSDAPPKRGGEEACKPEPVVKFHLSSKCGQQQSLEPVPEQSHDPVPEATLDVPLEPKEGAEGKPACATLRKQKTFATPSKHHEEEDEEEDLESLRVVRRQARARTENINVRTTRLNSEKVEPSESDIANTHFSQFLDASNIADIQASFSSLLEVCGHAADSTEMPYLTMKKFPVGSWKAKQVWELLGKRLKHQDHGSKFLEGRAAVVVGAGPVGLRAALELALQGATVTVLEKRMEFTRINRLHLWDWVRQDLIAWGAKVFSPPGGTFGADKDYCHIGIKELQYLLLKCCLLLGVSVELGVEFKRVAWKTGDESQQGWRVLTEPNFDQHGLPVDFVVACDGRASLCAQDHGVKSVIGGLGKEGQAIGIVANFKNSKTRADRDIRQFSWAKQFNVSLFKELKTKLSADLENVVYYKGDENHYMIMTPTKQCLFETGCLKTLEPSEGVPLLAPSNVDTKCLQDFARSVGAHFGLPQEFTPTQSAMAFDFSDTRRQEQSLMFVEASGADVPLPLCFAGDALLEPFWPTGLGCIRGFLSVLDCVSALQLWVTTQDRAAVTGLTEEAFRHLKSVEGKTKDMVLKPEGEWRLHPATRYRGYRGHSTLHIRPLLKFVSGKTPCADSQSCV